MIKELVRLQRDYLDFFFDHFNYESAEKIFQACLSCKGTIVFSGVGKSGIIAEKLAMTMISTGTKALSLTPMNALHGDIGILNTEDLFICVSKSGDTKELVHLLPYIKERKIQTIGWVCEENSSLSKLCDLHIVLPLKRELCPFDLAPTTSAVVQLIFGDILSVALMKAKSFSVQDFAKNHPAGNIGKKLTFKVEDLMLKGDELPLCSSEDTLADTIVELSSKRCGCVLIVDDKKELLGIFTDGDLRRALEQKKNSLLEQKMKDLMVPNCLSIERGVLLLEALRLMQRKPQKWVKELPVIVDKKLVGLIRMHDIVQIGLT